MYRWSLLLVGLIAALPLGASPLTELDRQLLATQAKLSQLQSQLQARQNELVTVNNQALQATRLLLHAQQYPVAFWDWHRILQGRAGPEVLSAAARIQARRLVVAKRRHQQLFHLYAALQSQQQALLEVRQQLARNESRQQRQQRLALAQAGHEASQLALALEKALQEGAALSVPQAPEVTLGLTPVAPRENLERRPPISGTLVLGFRRGEGAEREGVVFRAPAGTEVRSPLAGKVLFAGNFRQFGGLVIVESPNRHEDLLGGLGALRVRRGQVVRANDVLGELGPRGRLYWEHRVRGRIRDPLRPTE